MSDRVSKFTFAEKADAVARELQYRRRVYPRLVAGGTMRQENADKQIALFEELLLDLREFAETNDPQGRLI